MTVSYQDIDCNVCKRRGGIGPANVRRFSGPVVAIGYIFLVPSVLGMLLGLMMLFGTCSAAKSTSDSTDVAYQQAIDRMSISTTTAEKLKHLTRAPTDEDLRGLNLSQAQAMEVTTAWMMRSGGQAGTAIGTGIAGGASIFFIVSSFVGGLIGWILTMKRKVLLCGLCKGVHAETA